MTKNSRLKEARVKKGLSQKTLGILLGQLNDDKKPVSSQYITNLERGAGFSFDVAKKLAQILDTTPEWLSFGDYPVTSNSSDKYHLTNNGSNRNMRVLLGERNDHRGVPYYNLEMLTTIRENFLDIKQDPEYFIDAPPLNDCTAYIQIYGDTMRPDYAPGIIVGIKEVENLDFIMFGSAYYIITKKSWNSIKKIFLVFENELDPNSFILRNTNPAYPSSLIIPKSGIASMHIVKGRLIIDNG